MSTLRKFVSRTLAITLIFWLGVFSASKFDSVLATPPALVSSASAPSFPQAFATAVCSKDTKFLAAHVSPGFGATPQDFQSGLDDIFDSCTGFDYLGSYQTAVDGAIDYIFVLHYNLGSQFWVLTVMDGIVVKIA